jgi:hypothetical protein
MANELVYSEIEQKQTVTELPGAGPNATSDHAPLFSSADAENFRSRWREVQGDFVDEPRKAVERANELVARVIERLNDSFATERGKLENEWGQGKDVSTEDLRQALRRYRSFFDRLLSV